MRAARTAPRTVGERRRPSRDRKRPQQEGVEHQARVVPPLSEGPQRPGEQQEQLQRRVAFGLGEPVGGLQHRRPRGIPGVVAGDPQSEGTDGLDLGDDVERTPLVKLDVDEHERLDPRPQPGLGLAHPLGDRPHLAAFPGEQRDDPIGLAQLLGPQDDGLVAVEAHRDSGLTTDRSARLTAEITARSDARTMFELIPDPPQHPVTDRALDEGGRGRVPARAHRVLGVVQHPDVDPDLGQRVDERGDRPVRAAFESDRLAAVQDLDRQVVDLVGTVDLARLPDAAQLEPAPRRVRIGQVLVSEDRPQLDR